jgi:hypothetical protein
MSHSSVQDLKIEGVEFATSLDAAVRSRLDRVQWVALVVGVIALGQTAYGALVARSQFFFSYLFGWVFWLGLSLGCFLVAMIHSLTGGRWGYPTRRFLEAGFLVLPLMLVLFIPIFFGLHDLYPWARPAEVAVEKALQQRHVYENPVAFVVRSLCFLGVWIFISQLLRRWSLQQDATTDAAPTRKARALTGPGIVIYSLLGTFAFVDWVMSLEKHWYSTMFAVIVIIGQILVAYAFAVVLLTVFRKQQPLVNVVTPAQYHQLGNLLLAFVMFWTYVSFGQLLIVYSGDKPDEIDWYLHRIAGNWKIVVTALGVFHFFVPFYLLLFRVVKKRVALLTTLAGILFVMHIVEVYWLVMPSFHPEGLAVHWLDFTAPLGIGGVWSAFFLSRLKAAPLLPQRDPGLQFAFQYGQ